MKKSLSLLIFVLAFATLFLFPKPTQAAGLAQVWVRLDRMQASTATTGLICARTPSTNSGTEASVRITFPTGFTVSTTASNWTTSTANIPSGTTAWPGIGTATAASGQDVTFPSTDLSINTTYCFQWTGATTLTNATAGNNKTGTVYTQATGPTILDTGNYALSIISNDQVTVSATVSPTFQFTLTGSTLPLGTLSSASVTNSSSNVTAQVITNASAGWVMWVQDATANNGSLTSSSTGSSIPFAGTKNDDTPTNLSSNTGYGISAEITTDSATSGTGTVSQAAGFGAEYAGGTCSGGTSVGALENILRPIAAANGPTDGDTITVCARSKVSAIQQAATDYTDTLTLVAAGRF
jgi:hypothetical protein